MDSPLRDMENLLYKLLSDKTTGSPSVPLSWSSKKIDDRGCERIISFMNHSFEIGIGSPDKWYVIMRREAFHKMIRWYLIKWSFGEWFGLRRALWYWLLSRRTAVGNLTLLTNNLRKIKKYERTM